MLYYYIIKCIYYGNIFDICVSNSISTPTIANKDKSPTIATLILVLSQL